MATGVFCLLALLVHLGLGFNVDTEFATVVGNPHAASDSYFGFSVALRRSLPGTAWNSWSVPTSHYN